MNAALMMCCALLPAAGDEVKIEKGIVYGKGGGEKLMLDLARPTKGNGPFPLVVCIHGGAWQTGHRNEHHRSILLLAKQGYVAASVGYRLAPKHRWPAQIEDVKCAVRYLRSRAKALKIDPNRVAALGTSAGGHLALLLGLTEAKDRLEGRGGHAGVSSKVQCVINFFGPTDLRVWKPTAAGELLFRAGTGWKKGGDDILKDFAGTADRRAAVVAKLSPITHIDSKDPPVLTFHGTLDPLVPISQAHLLHAALKKSGVEEKLEVLENRLHGWDGADRNRTDALTLKFLDRHLKKKD